MLDYEAFASIDIENYTWDIKFYRFSNEDVDVDLDHFVIAHQRARPVSWPTVKVWPPERRRRGQRQPPRGRGTTSIRGTERRGGSGRGGRHRAPPSDGPQNDSGDGDSDGDGMHEAGGVPDEGFGESDEEDGAHDDQANVEAQLIPDDLQDDTLTVSKI